MYLNTGKAMCAKLIAGFNQEDFRNVSLRKDVHYATSVLYFIGNPRYSSCKKEERKRNKMRKGGGKKEGGGTLR